MDLLEQLANPEREEEPDDSAPAPALRKVAMPAQAGAELPSYGGAPADEYEFGAATTAVEQATSKKAAQVRACSLAAGTARILPSPQTVRRARSAVP